MMVRPPKVRDNELIEVVDSDNREGFLITTPEVADELDIDRRTASNRLKTLEEGEVVGEPHGRTTGWRLPMERIVKRQLTKRNEINKQDIHRHLQSKSPPLDGTTQIAEWANVDNQTAMKLLKELESDGVLGKKKIGQSYAWYLTETEVKDS